jgi:hypothetical protein
MSATSSVYNFRYENGRRYHAYAEGQYLVPNDEVRVFSPSRETTPTDPDPSRLRQTDSTCNTKRSVSPSTENYSELLYPRQSNPC